MILRCVHIQSRGNVRLFSGFFSVDFLFSRHFLVSGFFSVYFLFSGYFLFSAYYQVHMYNTITSLYRNCWLIIFQLLSKLDFLIDTVPEILNSLPPLFAFILFAFWLEFDGTTLVEIFCHIGQKFSMSTKHIRVLSFLHIFINLLAFFIKYFLRFLIDNE